ncbi:MULTISPECIES: cytochrome C oxidase subunit IV family protein [Pseudomonas]|jgi:hypothetical protein|uniref:Cytochrome c oxidase subunit IV n=3 Tax=Pseudomonas TaxID=286 RepID=A0A4Y9TCI3_PSEFL|nr:MULTISPECIES: cytochrome C oxidase subunit IV family protein [Pseudomonas]CRM92917.1 hypothetical protein [Pseudomonas sp. 22 E 5]MCX9152498.1 cytochrome C oxidase subunit IV family protein [Pseudomonas sp. TB1-B1]QXH65322.1 cytochrome C oxidase subunit IV family protein [Pseudomonas asgharzadehiana]TFW40537.1 hypothetical protein E4T65_25930 [Pseudomonas fluorescens]TKJ65280.1 hypothetical protein PspCFBP13506_00395 [Pseudomonas sp. CFBP13506]
MTAFWGLVACWLGLVGLSVGTVLAGASGGGWAVLLLAVVKAWVIVDGFMELRHAPRRWRALLLGWGWLLVLLVGISVGLIGH